MIKVLKAGLYSSIQDLGRFGYRKFGVPQSGAMDTLSLKMANALLNNTEECAVLETTLIGPKLEFNSSTYIVITGAEVDLKLNNIVIDTFKVYKVKIGDVLVFGNTKLGSRNYLAVKNGFNTGYELNSYSYFKGITLKQRIVKNDNLQLNNYSQNLEITGKLKRNNKLFNNYIIEVFKGPDFDLFNENDLENIISTKYTISSENNRMGYRLKEKVLPHKKSIITSPVLPGTVQLTPNGQLIVLMKDAQTTGGYPRIFQLTEKSVCILGQKTTNQKIKFKVID